MRELDGIKKKLAAHKEELKKQYKIAEIGIFGSVARNEAGKRSDVDVLVEFTKVPGFEFAALELKLEKILGRKVDLVRKKSLRPELRQGILNEVVYL